MNLYYARQVRSSHVHLSEVCRGADAQRLPLAASLDLQLGHHRHYRNRHRSFLALVSLPLGTLRIDNTGSNCRSSRREHTCHMLLAVAYTRSRNRSGSVRV